MRSAGLRDLHMGDDVLAVESDEHAALVHVGVEGLRRVLRQLEQRSQPSPRAVVLSDADGSRCAARVPALRHEHDKKAVRVFEREGALGPIRVRQRDGRIADPRRDRAHSARVANIEHQQRLGMRRGRRVRTARCELEMGVGAGDGQEHAVVAIMIAEAADFGQPDPVAVERHNLAQAFGVPGDPDLHGSIGGGMGVGHDEKRRRSRPGRWSLGVGAQKKEAGFAGHFACPRARDSLENLLDAMDDGALPVRSLSPRVEPKTASVRSGKRRPGPLLYRPAVRPRAGFRRSGRPRRTPAAGGGGGASLGPRSRGCR